MRYSSPESAADGVVLQIIPGQHHESAIGNNQIRLKESFPIPIVVRKVLERGSGGNHQQTAVVHSLDRLDGVTNKELDT